MGRGTRPMGRDTRPMGRGTRPMGRDTLPMGERHPSHGKRHPSHGKKHPSHGKRHPTHGKRHPAHGKRHPAHGKRHPAHGKRHPSHGKRHPAHGKRHPAHGKRHPSHGKEHTRPMGRGTRDPWTRSLRGVLAPLRSVLRSPGARTRPCPLVFGGKSTRRRWHAACSRAEHRRGGRDAKETIMGTRRRTRSGGPRRPPRPTKSSWPSARPSRPGVRTTLISRTPAPCSPTSPRRTPRSTRRSRT